MRVKFLKLLNCGKCDVVFRVLIASISEDNTKGFTYFGKHYGFRTLNHTIRANPIVPTTTEDQATICTVMISGSR